MAKTFALCLAPSAVLASCWLRLEQGAMSRQALAIAALAIAPALLRGRRFQAAAAAVAFVVSARLAFGIPLSRVRFIGPLVSRFRRGFLDFYDVRLPFDRHSLPLMHGVILVALFAFCLAVALAIAARRAVLAAAMTLVGAGWPATLLTGGAELWRGAAILAVVLGLLYGVPEAPRRRFVQALAIGVVVVLAGVAASTSSALAQGQVLHWQNWDFYNRPAPGVGVSYIWNSSYTGVTFPTRRTTVLRIKAPSQPSYWRATTLDLFDGVGFVESPRRIEPLAVGSRDELTTDPTLPLAARDQSRWVAQEVTVVGLRDPHLVGGSVPVAYHAPVPTEYGYGGVAASTEPEVPRGAHYTVWSYEARPTAAQLARSPARYPRLLRDDLEVASGLAVPPFGTPGRGAAVESIFAGRTYDDPLLPYASLYRTAQRVVGKPTSPYAAAVALEAWFRSGGGFRYDAHPPRSSRRVPPLVDFVLNTRRGYCQHYAGAMALMLRYLGVPARVAAGFTSGRYSRKQDEWVVTDHNAHTWVEAWFQGYGWLPFDPTPGRGRLSGSYTASSSGFSLSGVLLGLAAGTRAARDLSRLHLNGKPSSAPGNVDVPRTRVHRVLPVRGHGGSRAPRALGLLALLALGAGLSIVLGKLAIRRARYVTRDPRRLATACARELADYLVDQGAEVPRSATLGELGTVVESRLHVPARPFVSAVTAARFGPPSTAAREARRARRELRGLRRSLRAELSLLDRLLGLVSLRSLGFA